MSTTKNALKNMAITSVTEAITIIVGAAAGFLIINGTSKETYGLYTVIVTIVTLSVGLSDLGLSQCCLPIVAKRRGDMRWAVLVCNRVFRHRKIVLTFTTGFGVIYLYFLSNASARLRPDFYYAALIAFATTWSTIQEQNNRMKNAVAGEILLINKVNLTANVVRLTLIYISLTYCSDYFILTILCLSASTSAIVSNFLYRIFSRPTPFEDLSKPELSSIDQNILRLARPLILPGLYWQLQSSLLVSIASLFLNSTAIADLSAISRLTFALAIIDRAVSLIVYPAISNSLAGSALVSKIFAYNAAYFAVIGALVLSAVEFPGLWLKLIGSKYSTYESIIWMPFTGAALMSYALFIQNTLSACGRMKGQTAFIPIVLLYQAISYAIFKPNDLKGLLWFSIGTSFVYAAFQIFMITIFVYHESRGTRKELC